MDSPDSGSLASDQLLKGIADTREHKATVAHPAIYISSFKPPHCPINIALWPSIGLQLLKYYLLWATSLIGHSICKNWILYRRELPVLDQESESWLFYQYMPICRLICKQKFLNQLPLELARCVNCVLLHKSFDSVLAQAYFYCYWSSEQHPSYYSSRKVRRYVGGPTQYGTKPHDWYLYSYVHCCA